MAKQKEDKKVWDEVASVTTPTPATSTEKPKVADVPFGSPSELQKIIVAYRKHFRENPPEKTGVGYSNNGEGVRYYRSEDVFVHADEFVGKQKAMIDLQHYVLDSRNVIQLVLEHYETGEKKVVEADLGNPNSMGDFGARITYAPKYLIGLMFGVSVQTDNDVFKPEPSKVDEKNTVEAAQKVEQQKREAAIAMNPAKEAPPTEPSKSYQKAKEFIEKSTVVAMLDQALVKIENSTQMSDVEKEELRALVSEKRSSLS